ncbi:MAG: hypothetical protein AAF547_07435 [Actinomycetota bacterium]
MEDQQLPPAPNRAQALVAKAGYTVYEAGRTLFDQPVLVYLPRKARRWPDYDIVDHVGRPLGAELKVGTPSPFEVTAPSRIVDSFGSPVLEIRPSRHLLRTEFAITGVATGSFVVKGLEGSRVSIEANRERFGMIRSSRLQGLGVGEARVEDDAGNVVGRIRHLRTSRNPFRRQPAWVIGLDPMLRGPLRRLVVAAPSVLAAVRRVQEASA